MFWTESGALGVFILILNYDSVNTNSNAKDKIKQGKKFYKFSV